MKKALIYGLTLSIALTLTACGQPRAEEPGASAPAASAAVQTASPEESTEPTAKPETAPTTKPTQQTTQASTGQTQTPPSSENPTYEETEQAMIEAFGETSKKLEEEGYNSGHGNLTDEAMEAIGSSLSGGTPTTQPDTSSQGSTDQTQTPPDSGSVESDNVRTPAQTAAEDWIRQQLTGGSSDYTGRRDFTEEEIADIGSKLNVTD